MTYQEAAQKAIECQNACNLSGVTKTFAAVTTVLWEEARKENEGTQWVNTHPIVTLFLDKLSDLNGRKEDIADFSKAYDHCEFIAKTGKTYG
jgi:hypothetical protein